MCLHMQTSAYTHSHSQALSNMVLTFSATGSLSKVCVCQYF